jgi:benzoylformate decarboxylase
MTMMAANKAIVEILRGEGVEYCFGIPGATEILFMDALEGAPDIRYILGLHEVVCAGMAEGYARASGKVGFMNLHTAPGIVANRTSKGIEQPIETCYDIIMFTEVTLF